MKILAEKTRTGHDVGGNIRLGSGSRFEKVQKHNILFNLLLSIRGNITRINFRNTVAATRLGHKVFRLPDPANQNDKKYNANCFEQGINIKQFMNASGSAK
jgi:hypothetical protein